jgi:hypothetical protein
MPIEITFRGWRRPAVGALVDTVENARSRVRTTMEVRGLDTAGVVTRTDIVRLTAHLAGPGDVIGLQQGAIVGRFPAPGAVDAETTICPHVEFADPALPWRYTPGGTPVASDRALRPWLTLLVGTDDEIDVTGNAATLAASVLRAHPLGGTPATAHVQETGGNTLARVLTRRPLASRTRYIAVLVPTFVVVDGELVNAWASNQQSAVVLPVYSRWRFRTGPGGDFRTLAAKLEPGNADERTGLAPLSYPRVSGAAPLSVGGALTAIGGPAREPLPKDVRTDLARLRTRDTDQSGRRIVGLPTYGNAWHEEPAPDGTTWGATLNADPRHRGVAGLGLRLGVELQEELAELTAQQAGALDVAEERIRHLSLGIAASGSLWRRRLPADPDRRVWLFGPALRRVMATTGPVDELATADDRPLAPGWFSPAVRRALRRGPARTALAVPVAVDPARLNPAANRPPPPVPFAEAGLPRFDNLDGVDGSVFEARRDAVARRQGQASDSALAASVALLNMNSFPRHAALLARVQARTVASQEEGRPLPWVQLSLLLAAIGEGEDDPVFDEERAAPLVQALHDGFDDLVDDAAVVPDLLGELGDRPEAPPSSRPVDFGRMAAQLTAAFDPTAPGAIARRRVLDTITGLDPGRPLAPPEPCPGVDVPVWRRLAQMAPDWLLPGVGQLVENTVIAVGTNPAFVDAFLAGFNTRVVEELRWRNLRVATGCTPVRTFWFRSDSASGERVDDIVGIQRWTADSELGGEQHRPGGLSGADLVLVFRGQLFYRYPHTLLYLVSARHGGEPDFTIPPDDDAPRTLPTFQGRIGADVTFFGFVGTDPGQVDSVWVALDEPPSGFRFRNDVDAANDADDGALFADLAFDDPVRVLIRGNRLVPGGSL